MDTPLNRLLAKFKVSWVQNFGNDNEKVSMTPVVGDSDENKTFSKYTPTGLFEMHITNPAAMGFFKPGKEYRLTIEEVTN
jgi:hypothetical protein